MNFFVSFTCPHQLIAPPCKNLSPHYSFLIFSALLLLCRWALLSFLPHADPARTSRDLSHIVFAPLSSLCARRPLLSFSPTSHQLSLLSLFCLHSHCIHQILESVHHIHQHDIVHRDLKVSICRGASASNPPSPPQTPRPPNLCLLRFTLSVLFPLSILPPPCHVCRCRSCVRRLARSCLVLVFSFLFYPFVQPQRST